MDPRIDIVDKRMEGVEKVVAVSGGKGGIGKSTLAVTLAFLLSKKGRKVGLLDLDLWGPCAHVIMGAGDVQPEEEKGVVPPEVSGVKFMSVVYYTADRPLPLRKPDFSQAVLELLAVTQWGELDILIIDMPPGMSDAALDVVRAIKKINFCVVAAPSRVVMETVDRTVKLLKEADVPVIGAVENMGRGRPLVKDQMKKLGVPYWGEIGFDPELEDSLGDAEDLLKTDFAKSLEEIIAKTKGFW